MLVVFCCSRRDVQGDDGDEDEKEEAEMGEEEEDEEEVRGSPKRSSRPPQKNEDAATTGGAEIMYVAINTLLMAVASGLGALPFFFVRKLSRQWLGACNAIASGVMLAASFGLLQEGLDIIAAEGGVWRLLLGIVLGLVFIMYSQKFLDGHEVFRARFTYSLPSRLLPQHPAFTYSLPSRLLPQHPAFTYSLPSRLLP
jgi:hypothetical protein